MRILLAGWLSVGFGFSPVFAQQLTSGADFLQIPSGARGEAMGGAFTAVADDVNALTWNPAGLSMLEYPEFGYLYMLYLGDTGYNFGGFALPFRDGSNSGGFGLGAVNLGVPPFDSTNGLAPSVSASDTALFVSGAYRFNGLIALGLTGKYLMENIANYNATAFAGDFGLLATPSPEWRIGAGVFNLGQQVTIHIRFRPPAYGDPSGRRLHALERGQEPAGTCRRGGLFPQQPADAGRGRGRVSGTTRRWPCAPVSRATPTRKT